MSSGDELHPRERLSLHGDTGSTKAELMLDRLRGESATLFTPDQAENLLTALANCMDEAARISGLNEWLGPTIWRLAERLLPTLRERMPPDRSKTVTLKAFQSGRAIGWLTSVFRSETFAHGRFGDRPKPEESRLLTPEELDAVTEIMLTRYKALSFEDLLSTPQPVNLLFAWQQGGDQDGPIELISPQIATDSGLVDVLEQLTGRVSSTGGEYTTLSRSNVSAWLDYDQARERIGKIAAGAADTELSMRAEALLKAFETADRFG